MNDDDRDPALKTFADRIGALIETEMETTVSPDPVTVCVIVNRGDYFETVMVSNFEKPDYDALADAMGGGTYTVSLTRDVTASGQAQLPGTGSISNG